MRIQFKRLTEYLTLIIDRKEKKLKVSCDNTNYKEEELPWDYLFDKCEFHKKHMREDNSKCMACEVVKLEQHNITKDMTDEDFVNTFKNQMEVYGFSLDYWENE